MKTAIVVLSDPKGGEEALGRLFNALAAVFDLKQRKKEVLLVFQGTGTRWAGVVTQHSHPAHALYKAVEDKVAGVSCGCADVFGARADAEKNGFSLLTENAVPGTTGLPSLAKYAEEGYSVITF
ncbi:MAG TPA: DsrE family protein [Gallionella sp.]|nr:DsrE family protein [Gallionella sp.]